jgi:hypothetical protein
LNSASFALRSSVIESVGMLYTLVSAAMRFRDTDPSSKLGISIIGNVFNPIVPSNVGSCTDLSGVPGDVRCWRVARQQGMQRSSEPSECSCKHPTETPKPFWRLPLPGHQADLLLELLDVGLSAILPWGVRLSEGVSDVEFPDHIFKLSITLLLGSISNQPFRYTSIVDEIKDAILCVRLALNWKESCVSQAVGGNLSILEVSNRLDLVNQSVGVELP